MAFMLSLIASAVPTPVGLSAVAAGIAISAATAASRAIYNAVYGNTEDSQEASASGSDEVSASGSRVAGETQEFRVRQGSQRDANGGSNEGRRLN